MLCHVVYATIGFSFQYHGNLLVYLGSKKVLVKFYEMFGLGYLPGIFTRPTINLVNKALKQVGDKFFFMIN